MNRCLLAVLTSLLLCQTEADKPRPTAKNELEGEWAVSVWDFEGVWMTGYDGPIGEHYRDLRVTFTPERMIVKPKEGGRRITLGINWEDAYTSDPAKRPKEIDVTRLWHPSGKPSEIIHRGIYDLRGDQLTICIDRSEHSKRPTAFGKRPTNPYTILLLERVKK